jgi:hypothetical protein
MLEPFDPLPAKFTTAEVVTRPPKIFPIQPFDALPAKVAAMEVVTHPREIFTIQPMVQNHKGRDHPARIAVGARCRHNPPRKSSPTAFRRSSWADYTELCTPGVTYQGI